MARPGTQATICSQGLPEQVSPNDAQRRHRGTRSNARRNAPRRATPCGRTAAARAAAFAAPFPRSRLWAGYLIEGLRADHPLSVGATCSATDSSPDAAASPTPCAACWSPLPTDRAPRATTRRPAFVARCAPSFASALATRPALTTTRWAAAFTVKAGLRRRFALLFFAALVGRLLARTLRTSRFARRTRFALAIEFLQLYQCFPPQPLHRSAFHRVRHREESNCRPSPS